MSRYKYKSTVGFTDLLFNLLVALPGIRGICAAYAVLSAPAIPRRCVRAEWCKVHAQRARAQAACICKTWRIARACLRAAARAAPGHSGGGQPLPRRGAAMATSGEDLSVLILIGMRGCGKTANGIAAAKALGRAFIDLDDVFEEEVSAMCCVSCFLL